MSFRRLPVLLVVGLTLAPLETCGACLLVLLIVSITANLPEVRLHGLATTRFVLLREERCAVGCDLREVFHAGVNRGGDGTEAQTSGNALLRLADVHTIGVTLADVETRAVWIRGRGGAVRTNQVIAVTVTIYFLRFCQGALYELNTRRVRYFSHRCWL